MRRTRVISPKPQSNQQMYLHQHVGTWSLEQDRRTTDVCSPVTSHSVSADIWQNKQTKACSPMHAGEFQLFQAGRSFSSCFWTVCGLIPEQKLVLWPPHAGIASLGMETLSIPISASKTDSSSNHSQHQLETSNTYFLRNCSSLMGRLCSCSSKTQYSFSLNTPKWV